jgi:hypothetical protein
MKFEDVLINILLGAIGSIVATAILFFLSSLYRFRYKDSFLLHLSVAKTAVYQIANTHKYTSDYYLIMQQIDILHRSCISMAENLLPLALWYKPQNRKLIYLLLYDIIQNCERIKYTTVGYRGDTEIQARLQKLHYIFYKFDFDSAEYNNQDVVSVQLDTIEKLLNGKSFSSLVYEIKGRYFCPSNEDTIDFWECMKYQFVDGLSFNPKIKKYVFSPIQKKGLTQKKYYKFLDKIKNKK